MGLNSLKRVVPSAEKSKSSVVAFSDVAHFYVTTRFTLSHPASRDSLTGPPPDKP
ncbi:hypothetical protein [Salinimonas iocasae]|uniref:hypothetical protein n=1 Tax=Salinimonas iocasae TaxID=2572577 RepID=UPI00143D0860|nr:hypothetical protein [Salinimonas iocasae]